MLDWFFKRLATTEKNGKNDRLNGSMSSSKTGKVSDIVKSNIDEYSPASSLSSAGPASPSAKVVNNAAEQAPRGGLFFARCFDSPDCAKMALAMFQEH